jgi:hypothetical protein
MLAMLILKALSLGPMHGYGDGQRIMQLAEDLLRVEEGMLQVEEKNWQRFVLAIGNVMQTA